MMVLREPNSQKLPWNRVQNVKYCPYEDSGMRPNFLEGHLCFLFAINLSPFVHLFLFDLPALDPVLMILLYHQGSFQSCQPL
jgi:hypothetical protein